MPTSSFTGLDPERLDDLAAELRRQSTVLDDAHRSVRTALGIADLVDSSILRRLADRSERFQMIADELDGRAQMVRDFALGFPSPAAAEAARARITSGLDSFDTIDELTEKVDNWAGSDNDPLLDDLVYRLHQAQADDRAYRALWAEWAAGLVALEEADLAAEQALTDIRSFLHVDNQSGWTPWHDGDAEVTPEDAADALAILAALEEVPLALVVDQLNQAELNRLADGLAGDATHAEKPWGHWVWSPVQAPVRETRNWVGEISAAGTEASTGLAEGFYAMGTQQGGPSPYNPYPANHIEEHFNESGRIVLEGSIPLLSNGARCTTGDGWSCVTFGAEVALWAAGEMVGGVIVSTIARTPVMTMVRVRLHDGSERVVAIINQRIRHSTDEVVVTPTLDLATRTLTQIPCRPFTAVLSTHCSTPEESRPIRSTIHSPPGSRKSRQNQRFVFWPPTLEQSNTVWNWNCTPKPIRL